MRRSPFLTLLNRLAGKIALPLALALLLAGLPSLLPVAPAHGTSLTADRDQSGDSTILEKRQLPLTLTKPKSGGLRLTRTSANDGKAALLPPSALTDLPARTAEAAAPPARGDSDRPWRRHHRLPPNTGPPAA